MPFPGLQQLVPHCGDVKDQRGFLSVQGPELHVIP